MTIQQLYDKKLYYRCAKKLAKYFGTQPTFLYYVSDKKEHYLGKCKKGWEHKDLYYIGGIPFSVACRLYCLGMKRYKDNCFYVKENGRYYVLFVDCEADNIFDIYVRKSSEIESAYKRNIDKINKFERR